MSIPPSSSTARPTKETQLCFGHVERERDVGVDPLDAARTAGDAHSGFAQLANGRGAEAAGGACDDGGLAGELHGS
jgi:hypothetical protein